MLKLFVFLAFLSAISNALSIYFTIKAFKESHKTIDELNDKIEELENEIEKLEKKLEKK